MRKINICGENRYPEYAILLPTGRVLVRAGLNLGLSELISKKAAKAAGIQYECPVKWADSEIYLYGNREVRNKSGKYLGKYLGYEQDDFSGGIINSSDFGGSPHDIFIEDRNKNIYRVSYSGEMNPITPEEMILLRLHWSSEWAIAGSSARPEDVIKVIKEVADFHEMALKGALLLKKYVPEYSEHSRKRRIHKTEECA